VAPPVNDTRATATVETGDSGTDSGTTVDATPEAGTVYATGWNDVWYTWTNFTAGLVTIAVSTFTPASGVVAAWSSTTAGAGIN
jgi:hypothetical protein